MTLRARFERPCWRMRSLRNSIVAEVAAHRLRLRRRHPLRWRSLHRPRRGDLVRGAGRAAVCGRNSPAGGISSSACRCSSSSCCAGTSACSSGSRFLWQVSRCRLGLVPDASGPRRRPRLPGACTPTLSRRCWSRKARCSRPIANKIFFDGARLPYFKVEIVAVVACRRCSLVLAPLLVFVRQLAAAKRTGLREYGTLAQRYVRRVRRQVAARRRRDGRAAGRQRRHPVAGRSRQQLRARAQHAPRAHHAGHRAAARGITLLPVAPLLLTMISLEELFKQFLKIVF